MIRFTCNISWTGRLIRLAAGLLLLADGLVMWRWNMPGASPGWRLLQGAIMAAGSFAIFEGVMGWCAVRALGYKTRF